MNAAKRLAILAALLVAGWTTTARAADWHHLHLTATDAKAAAEWYAKYMEGQAAVFNNVIHIVTFGTTPVAFYQKEAGFLGSSGSSIDHVGWSFKDLDAKMKEFEAAGIKILQPARGLGAIKFGFIEDPWGTKIEVMQDPDLYGFHHVHLHAADPDAVLAWYANAFGGTPAKYANFLPAIRYNDMWLICQKQSADKEGTKGRSVDHLGFKYEDLDAAIAKAKADGVKVEGEPAMVGPLKVAFIEGPGGVQIEIVQEMPPAAPAAAPSGQN